MSIYALPSWGLWEPFDFLFEIQTSSRGHTRLGLMNLIPVSELSSIVRPLSVSTSYLDTGGVGRSSLSRSILRNAMNFIKGWYVRRKKKLNQMVPTRSGTSKTERKNAVRRERTPIIAIWKTTSPMITRLQIIGHARPVECCRWSIA